MSVTMWTLPHHLATAPCAIDVGAPCTAVSPYVPLSLMPPTPHSAAVTTHDAGGGLGSRWMKL